MRTVSELIGDGYLDWKPGIPYVLSSQTGRGKTTFVMTQLLKHAAAQDKYVLYICNRKSLYSQVEQIISNMTQELKNTFSLTEEESTHLVIQTYQHYEAGMVNPFGLSKVLYIIFDEAHYFLEDASFNSATNLWTNWIKNYYKTRVNTESPICIFMTATPEPLMCFLAAIDGKKPFSAGTFFGILWSTYWRLYYMKSEVERAKRDFGPTWEKDIEIARPEVVKYPREISDTDVYSNGKTFIKDALHLINNNVEEINDDPDYDYVEVYYFREFNELVNTICQNDEKWLVFINNSVKGQKIDQKLNALGIEAAFVASSLRNEAAVREQLKQLETKQSFSCKVLITTSVLDCGINILDDAVHNIVIFEAEKTTFLQMLGRVRIRGDRKIRLFIKAPTALEMRNHVRHTCKIIQMMYGFYLLQKNYYYGNGWIIYYEPVMNMYQRRSFLQNLQRSNYKIIHLRHDLLVGYNWINRDITQGWNEGKILSEYVLNYNLLVRSLYMLYCFDQAKAYMQEEKADDVYYLKYQLSWLGKEYDERRWVSYARQRDEITAFLDGYLTNEDGMLAEEQNVFAEKAFELLCQLSVIPSVAKKNRSALKRSGHAPGKNILNKCFEEIGLPYIITSKSKMQNGKREQRWYVKKANAETGNGELCY